MPFTISMTSRKPKDYFYYCYFCITKTEDFSIKWRDKIAYPNLDSARLPVPHDKSMPPPLPPKDGLDSINTNTNEATNTCGLVSANSTYSGFKVTEETPVLYSHKHLND